MISTRRSPDSHLRDERLWLVQLLRDLPPSAWVKPASIRASRRRRKNAWYLADILDKKYYYCGTEWLDVKVKLRELGIGKPDPL